MFSTTLKKKSDFFNIQDHHFVEKLFFMIFFVTNLIEWILLRMKKNAPYYYKLTVLAAKLQINKKIEKYVFKYSIVFDISTRHFR